MAYLPDSIVKLEYINIFDLSNNQLVELPELIEDSELYWKINLKNAFKSISKEENILL